MSSKFDNARNILQAVFDVNKNPIPPFIDALAREAETLRADTPAAIHEELTTQCLDEIVREATALIERGGFSLEQQNKLITAFHIALLEKIRYERASGRLHVTTPTDEVRRVAGQLEKCLWNGTETQLLITGLEVGETITGVTFRTIETTKRTIRRGGEFFLNQRPVSVWPNQFSKGLTQDRVIDEAEQQAARDEALRNVPFRETSGPSPEPRN